MAENPIASELIRALIAKYTAEILECRATIRVYLERPAGIGEHPQILQELDTLVGRLSDATDRLEAVQGLLPESTTIH